MLTWALHIKTDRSVRKQTDRSVFRWNRPRNGWNRQWTRHFVRCTKGNDKSCQGNVRGIVRIVCGTEGIHGGRDISSAARREMTKVVRETASERGICFRNEEFARGTMKLIFGWSEWVSARRLRYLDFQFLDATPQIAVADTQYVCGLHNFASCRVECIENQHPFMMLQARIVAGNPILVFHRP
jgi:hypothetical protein